MIHSRQDVWEQWRGRLGVAMFQVAESEQQVSNVTHRLSLLVPLARRVCTSHTTGGGGGGGSSD